MDTTPLILLENISEAFKYVAASTREFIYLLANDKKFTQDLVFTSVTTVWTACVTKTFLSEDKTLPISLIRLSSKALLAGSIATALGMVITLGITLPFDVYKLRQEDWKSYGIIFSQIWWYSKNAILIAVPASLLLHFIIKRFFEPWISCVISKLAKSAIKVSLVPDSSNIEEFLPIAKPHDPRKYFKKAQRKNNLFFGLNAENKPIFVSLEHFYPRNMQVLGAPGSGKGVISTNLIWQLISYDNACVVFNPKPDKWAPIVLSHACKAAGKKLVRIDLSANYPSLNPIMKADQQSLYELLIAVFGLIRTADGISHYRNFDRKGAHILSQLANENPNLTLLELSCLSRKTLGEFAKETENLLTQLEELARIPAVQTDAGFDLAAFIEEGGCLLIEGDTVNESVITLMKMVLSRVIQIVNKRVDRRRHVIIFCDEVKYLLNKPLIDALGTLRDKNANFILTHQSLSDLEDAETQLSPTAARNSVIDNTLIKWCYSTTYESALWVSNQVGTQNGYEETIETYSNSAAAHGEKVERKYRMKESPLIHPNIIMKNPEFCAVAIGIGDGTTVAFTSKIIVDEIDVPFYQAPKLLLSVEGDELL